MIFTNQATLLYNNMTTTSNITSGTLISPLSVTKSTLSSSYSLGVPLTYTVTIVNSSSTAYTGLTILDNLGQYDWDGFSRFSLAYTDGSATLTIYNGSEVTPGTVTELSVTGGIEFSFDVPANSVVLLNYEVNPTIFASPNAGATITNTATLSGNAPLLPLSAQNTIPVNETADLIITKGSSAPSAVGEPLSFTFTIANYGNIATQAEDYITLSDLFSPPLTNISVVSGTTLWTEGNQYVYDEGLYYFQTQPGAIQLEAATFTQDSFGRWNSSPASTEITVTGTVEGTPSAQSLIEILPSYTDGNEAFLSVQHLQNDMYLLGSTGGVVPAFTIISNPDSVVELAPTSDSHFSLSGNVLSVNTLGITDTISAFIQVNFGGGFIVQTDYIP